MAWSMKASTQPLGKNDAFVTLYHSAVDQESIDAGFETLNMVLDRL